MGFKIEKEGGSFDLATERMRVVKYPKYKELKATFVYHRYRRGFLQKDTKER